MGLTASAENDSNNHKQCDILDIINLRSMPLKNTISYYRVHYIYDCDCLRVKKSKKINTYEVNGDNLIKYLILRSFLYIHKC